LPMGVGEASTRLAPLRLRRRLTMVEGFIVRLRGIWGCWLGIVESVLVDGR
jgi:hypothetical protein